MDRFEYKRIDEALELLNAAACDNKAELQAVIANRHADLSSVVSAFTNEIKNRAIEKFVAGKQKVVDVATDVNNCVHNNPWGI